MQTAEICMTLSGWKRLYRELKLTATETGFEAFKILCLMRLVKYINMVGGFPKYINVYGIEC